MANTINTIIKLRNDTLTNWANSSVKIFKGEAALALDPSTNKYEVRIGDDASGKTWSQLASSNLTIPAENVIGLTNSLYDYQLTSFSSGSSSDGSFKLQKRLHGSSDAWTDVTTVTLQFTGDYDAATNPIALQDYVDNQIEGAISDLDTTSDVGIASVTNNVVTIKGSVKQVDGLIAQGTASDVTLSEVAVTGAASDVSVAADETSGLTAGTVQGTLQDLKTAIDNVNTDSVVTMESADGTTDAILKTYTFYQGLNGETGAAKEAKKIGTVNIPKDFLIKSGTLETVSEADVPYSGAQVGDKYLDLVLNTKDTSGGSETDSHVYIPVNDLFDSYTSGSTAGDPIEITVNNSNNTISATCNISGSATIATVSDGVVTIKAGVTQASGAVSNSSGSDITLAKVATTGTAADVAITDSGSLIEATNVETALQELAGKSNTAVQTVTGETAISGGNDDYVSVSASKSGTEVTLDSKVKVQAVSTSDPFTAKGLAEASDVKSYVDTEVAKKAEYLGTASAMPTTASVTISGNTVTANKGDFITYSGAEYFWSGTAWLGLGKINNVTFAGTSLTVTNGTASITKAAALSALNVEDGAQVNVIETVKVGGTALTPDANKAVDIDNLILDGGSSTVRSGLDEEGGASGHAETRFTVDGAVESHNITGTLDQQWMVANGYFDETMVLWVKSITQADIGNTVTSIGSSAFEECRGLTSVTIPNSVTSIGNQAFILCDALETITVLGKTTDQAQALLADASVPEGCTIVGELG